MLPDFRTKSAKDDEHQVLITAAPRSASFRQSSARSSFARNRRLPYCFRRGRRQVKSTGWTHTAIVAKPREDGG